jgi:hypothetical protein
VFLRLSSDVKEKFAFQNARHTQKTKPKLLVTFEPEFFYCGNFPFAERDRLTIS